MRSEMLPSSEDALVPSTKFRSPVCDSRLGAQLCDGCGAAADSEALEDVLEVLADGAFRHEQSPGDLPVGVAGLDEL